MRNFGTTLMCAVLAASFAFGGASRMGKKVDSVAPERRDDPHTKFAPFAPHNLSPYSLVGAPTTLTGFWDFQVNGGACEMIRVNPSNGNIHVIMMIADDSIDQSGSRRTAYAFSTDNGGSWNNFGNLRVPDRRSGYPFLDIGQGPLADATVIANHNAVANGILQSTVYIDAPEGGGAFIEVPPPSLIETGGADEPVWPAMAVSTDGSIIMAPGRLTANTSWITRTTDYLTWSPWLQFPGTEPASARNVVVSNGTGRVAVLENASVNTVGGINVLESTDNGVTWPSAPVPIFPATYQVGGSDTTTFVVGSGDDAVYDGDNLLVVSEGIGNFTVDDDAQIHFWSAATGRVVAVPHDTSRFISALTTAQVFQSTVGYPVIGLSGGTIVVVFAAFQRDISAANFNYCDLWWTASTNGGTVWTTPVNITNTQTVDERYPSISKWNPPGFANIVWQEKLDPGSSVRSERPITRADQKFLRFAVPLATDVPQHGEVANTYRLSQNYPNPFNPTTGIDYTIARAGHVTLRVYDMLGKEVATLVNQEREPGAYRATFDASSFPSGVYIYQLRAGSYSESKKMALVK